MDGQASSLGAIAQEVLTSAGVREFIVGEPLTAGLVAAVFAAFACDVLFGLPYSAAEGLRVWRGARRRVSARRAALKLRSESGKRFSVLLAPFQEDETGGLSALMDRALESHAPSFLFEREVEIARPPVSLEGPESEPAARLWSERSDADLVIWGSGSRRGLMRLYFLTATARDTYGPIQEIRLVPPVTPGERDRLAAGVAYVLARTALPCAENADAYRTEKLSPVLDALDKLASDPPNGLGASFERVLREDAAKIAFSVGRRDRDGAALRRASRLRVRLLAEIDRQDRPEEWAVARAELGRAQLALGEAEDDPRRLEAAIEAFAEAAEMLRGEALRGERASALLDLARAHHARSLGERDTSHLSAAAKAYRAAMKVAPEQLEARFIDEARRGLASVLHSLAETTNDVEGLRQAIEVHRAAATERSRAVDPVAWAQAQHDLGRALVTLATLEDGPERYREAVEAFHAALEERTREADAEAWAETMSQLGHSSYQLGRAEAGEAGLEAAIEAYQGALDVRDRDDNPLLWAQTRNNLGNAMQALGERTGERWRLEGAVREYRAALSVFTRDDNPTEWAGTQNNLGNALHVLGERGDSVEALKDALRAHVAALEVRTKENNRVDWAATRNNIGLVLTTLGSRTNDRRRLEQAVGAYRDALGVFRLAGALKYAHTAERNLEHAQNLLDESRRPQ
ncbi:MAG: tetratricopeptide repeat protein [Caulobacterales bacterium]|nr:tetratricopeptide repeat protein [Caulobacterales bacterium]